jgi:hypothetical protein
MTEKQDIQHPFGLANPEDRSHLLNLGLAFRAGWTAALAELRDARRLNAEETARMSENQDYRVGYRSAYIYAEGILTFQAALTLARETDPVHQKNRS